jgi:hypothetical protein
MRKLKVSDEAQSVEEFSTGEECSYIKLPKPASPQ